jgi:uncharacterized protein (TIGR03435 family)
MRRHAVPNHLAMTVVLIGGTALAGLAQTRPTFDVVSIKLNTSGVPGSTRNETPGTPLALTNAPALTLIRIAYPAQNREVVGAPDWTRTERYDVIAKARGTPSRDDVRAMTQAMLADRFRLQAHYEDREEPVYKLVLARSDGRLGDGIRRSTLDCDAIAAANRRGEKLPDVQVSNGAPPCGMRQSSGVLEIGGQPMEMLARVLATSAGRVVVDATGLTGNYELTLRFAPQPSPGVRADNAPSVFTALQEQLGLKLEPARAPLQTLVVDHIERPTEN